MTPDDFKRLVSAGMTTDQIAIVMEMMDRDARAYAEADEARKAKGRDRVAKWRLERRNVTVTQPNVTVRLAGEPARVEDKTLTSEIEPQKEEKKETREALSSEFDQFWDAFPNKVGKPKARASFAAVRRKFEFAPIMAGLARYVAAKPADRPWLNPATFLNQERWADQPATVVAPRQREGPGGGVRRGVGGVFDDLEDFLDGQGNGDGTDQAPQGVVLSISHRAA